MERIWKLIRGYRFYVIAIVTTIVTTGCPEFSAINYPKTVFAGDTIEIQVEIDLVGYKKVNSTKFGIRFPEGWRLMTPNIYVHGLGEPKIRLVEGYYEGSIHSAMVQFITDTLLAPTLSTKFILINELSESRIDNIEVFFDDYDYARDYKSFEIQTVTDPKVPTQIQYVNNTLKWQSPKDRSFKFIELKINETSNRIRSGTNELINPFSEGVNRISMIAHYPDRSQVENEFPLVIHIGDKLFVSPNGDDSNNGTENFPLKSISTAIGLIDNNYLLSRPKTIILEEGEYNEDALLWRDRVSLKGNGPMNTILNIRDGINNEYSPYMYHGFSLTDLTINGGITLSQDFWSKAPEVKIANVHFKGDQSIGINSNLDLLKISNCLFEGLMVGISGSFKHISHSNFVGNMVAVKNSGYYFYNGYPLIVNSIFFENELDIEEINLFEGKILNSIINEQFHSFGPDNFAQDPLFSSTPELPYLLDANSPAVDAAYDSIAYNDPLDPSTLNMAQFPARGTIRGDLGIYGGLEYATELVLGKRAWIKSLSVFPNPTRSTVQIDYEGQLINGDVTLIDLSGNRYPSKVNNNILNLDHLARGIYILQVPTNGEIVTKKIMKE